MENVIEWIKGNWGSLLLIISGVIAVLSIVNKATQHWSSLEGKWYRKIVPVSLFFLTELLSVLTSRDSPGTWKLPFTSKPPR